MQTLGDKQSNGVFWLMTDFPEYAKISSVYCWEIIGNLRARCVACQSLFINKKIAMRHIVIPLQITKIQ